MRITCDAHIVLRQLLARRESSAASRPTVLDIARDLGWPLVEKSAPGAAPRVEVGSE